MDAPPRGRRRRRRGALLPRRVRGAAARWRGEPRRRGLAPDRKHRQVLVCDGKVGLEMLRMPGIAGRRWLRGRVTRGEEIQRTRKGRDASFRERTWNRYCKNSIDDLSGNKIDDLSGNDLISKKQIYVTENRSSKMRHIPQIQSRTVCTQKGYRITRISHIL